MLQEFSQLEQKILHHEDLFDSSYIAHIAIWFQRNQFDAPKVIAGKPVINGEVGARVDDGRWIVECPNADPETGASRCNSAAATSRTFDVFICGECGSPENDGAWYLVKYPEDRVEVERLLLLRPANKGRAAGVGGTRFFSPFDVNFQPDAEHVFRLIPKQTTSDLIAENLELGCGI